MKSLVILAVVLGSIITACQNSDLTSTPQLNDTPVPQNVGTPTPTTAQTAQPSRQANATPSAQGSEPMAAIANSPASSQRSCSLSAYVIDKDPQGLNVRSNPGNNSKIIGKLPTTTAGVIVNLAASQGNWVRLTQAESSEKIEFQGTGWVYAPLLGTSTRGYGSSGVSIYSNSSTQSAAIGRIPPDTSVKLIGCDQSWALVEYQGLKGWLEPESQCGNPFTTCS